MNPSKKVTSFTAQTAENALRRHAESKCAKSCKRFFKMGPGEYAQKDIFIGVTVPQTRKIALIFRALPLRQIEKLVSSPVHEVRLLGLVILVHRFSSGGPKEQKKIADCYLLNLRHVNNWDLVDLTADKILGATLFKKNKKLLFRLARSPRLWDRRIAMIATFYFIKNRKYNETFRLAKLFLKDPHDLMHKATGWMLREIGKRDLAAEERFLRRYAHRMPRTALRYAIERFPRDKRAAYLMRGRK